MGGLLESLPGGWRERACWRRLEAARHAMGDDDWAALNELSAHFSERVRDEVVDAEVGDYTVERFAYRMRELRAVVDASEGMVREYLAAFEATHELITVLAGFMEP
jgi:hypothetical protein